MLFWQLLQLLRTSHTTISCFAANTHSITLLSLHLTQMFHDFMDSNSIAVSSAAVFVLAFGLLHFFKVSTTNSATCKATLQRTIQVHNQTGLRHLPFHFPLPLYRSSSTRRGTSLASTRRSRRSSSSTPTRTASCCATLSGGPRATSALPQPRPRLARVGEERAVSSALCFHERHVFKLSICSPNS